MRPTCLALLLCVLSLPLGLVRAQAPEPPPAGEAASISDLGPEPPPAPLRDLDAAGRGPRLTLWACLALAAAVGGLITGRRLHARAREASRTVRPLSALPGVGILSLPNQEGGPDTAPDPGPSTPGLLDKVDRLKAIERDEHSFAVRRLRGAAWVGLLFWPQFVLLDWLVVRYIEPGPLTFFLAVRGAGLLLFGGALLLLSRGPSPRLLRAADVFIFAAFAVLLSLLCLRARGVQSPIATGIILVMIARTATTAEPWHWGAVSYGLMALAFPVVCAVAGRLGDPGRLGFGDPQAVATFAASSFFLVSAGAMMTVAGHLMWQLRRRAFEERHVGRYRLSRRIGRGGMGEVWIAQHQGLKRDVALKILDLDLAEAQATRLRFEREVRVTAELTHPNTIRIMDYGVTPEGVWYYAMELLSGDDLGALVRREGPLPAARAVHLLRQACASLAEAHRRGVVHRDIKPENLFVTTLGDDPDFIKVLDFGIVKLAAEARRPDDASLTVEGTVAGSPLYMSPEQAQGMEIDARSDVYALGATLYFALTGAPPFSGATDWVIMAKHVREEPEPPSRRLAVPADVEAIVLRCLRKDPAARYADAAEVGEALSRCACAGTWRLSPGTLPG